MAIITASGIAIPSVVPRVSVEGEDEDLGDCRVDSIVGEDSVVADHEIVEPKVGIVVAMDDPDWLLLVVILKYADETPSDVW
jgi:hypothetical protein